MKYPVQFFLSILWGSGILLSKTAYGASVSLDGAPAGFTRPLISIRNKTDFNGIFSDIKNHKVTPLHSGASLAARDLPPAPNFFNLVFPGPLEGANNAPGYMGYVSLPTYDVNACAQQCNTRAYQAPLGSSGGSCIYFNLWTAVVDGVPSANICSMYNTVTDSSTATNTGQGNLQITNSLGYSRISLIQDGSFQDYTCIITQTNGCPYTPSIYWNRFFIESYDYVLVNNFEGHSGTSSAFFLFAPPTPDSPAYGSTLTYSLPLGTVPGQAYVISLFVTNSDLYPAPANLTGPMMSVLWNGVDVLDAVQVGPETFNGLTYFNIQATVIAQGSDTFVLKNGVAFAHAMYADDIALFPKWF